MHSQISLQTLSSGPDLLMMPPSHQVTPTSALRPYPGLHRTLASSSGFLMTLASMSDLLRILPGHLEMLTSPLTHLSALTSGLMVTMTSPPCDMVVTASLPVILLTLPDLLMERASPYNLVMRLPSAPGFLGTLSSASNLLMLLPDVLRPSWMIPRLRPSLQMLLLPVSASRLNKIGPRASLVYARQPRGGQLHLLLPVQPHLELLQQPPPRALGPYRPPFPR